MTDETDGFPESPFAKFPGILDLGGTEVDVYVLDTGERVISLRATLKAIADRDGGNLAEFIGVQALKSYINKDLVLAETVEFNIPGTQLKGRGIPAERFLDICRAYVAAWKDKALTTDRQREIAMQCAILLASCANVGLIALIDEATGYQHVRAEDALQVKLRAFISEELRNWEKTFPDELWEEFGRLTKWKGSLHSRPKWWGHVVLETIYEALDPDIAAYLKEHKPPPRHGQNYHQWMTQDIGLKALITHIHQVIGVAKTCATMKEFREKVAHYYKKEPIQLTLFVPKMGNS